MARTALILVDTCVLLDDPEVLVRIRQRGGLPFLTSTVLDELDYNKSGNAQINVNARMIFREFNRAAPSKLAVMPTGEPLQGEDVLTQFLFRDGPVFLVARDDFRSRSNNDAKIIELAKDYRMVLITRDAGMKVRAAALGVDVAFWSGPEEFNRPKHSANLRQHSQNNLSATQAKVVRNEPKPFALFNSPINESDTSITVGEIPETGNIAKLGDGSEFCLGSLISSGGEGSIYATQLTGYVCKIYHRKRLTRLKQRKIELMVSRRITRPGICWPTEIVTNAAGEFIGYLMPRATGITMQSAMFVKPRLEKTFPNWNRLDLVNVAGTLLDHISYLHSLNIIVGDINPMNLLVMEDSTKVWIVDTDSFQIENYPCPVGTVNFTPPEIQGKNYAEFLRTKDQELFAVATMVFMILHPGKPPYSQQGGGSPAENIKAKNFPYRYVRDPANDDSELSGKNAPQGTWQFIWANLPKPIREAFYSTFRENKRTEIDQWTFLLSKYRYMLEQGHTTNELFSLSFKVRDPVEISCAKCTLKFIASQQYVDKLTSQGKKAWCPECANRARVERLVIHSRRSAGQATAQPTWSSRGIQSHSPWQMHQPQTRPTPQRTGSPGPCPNYGAGSSNHSSNNNGGGIFGAIIRLIFK